ncbi:hypothetical protein OIU79_020003 [Salix purpurea]|uniref:Uncharacterized protein n=1 Tax=Salix purpurea TaxID=77065 RepID=A0A9Q0SKH5_SALPP|nr:hypothetical protein OIU79_020003 [Salix purpurea]
MGSGKPERHSQTKKRKGLSIRNPSKKINLKKEKGMNKKTELSKNKENQNKSETSTPASASQQLSFFINEFQSANGVQLSSIELESISRIRSRCNGLREPHEDGFWPFMETSSL